MSREVWLYWEGPLPAYIALCIRTVARHNEQVILLDRAGFDRLFQHDRDLDIDRLSVVHRSDFIRSYLLCHYGGLYLDVDCVVLRSLNPILDLAERFGFVGFRESSDLVANGLMASVPHGAVIEEHYRRVCVAIRAGSELAWSELGSFQLTPTVASLPYQAHLLLTELVSPVSWNSSGRLAESASDAEHNRHFDRRAYCYMLYNATLKSLDTTRFLVNLTAGELLAGDLFLSFLLRQALGAEGALPDDRSQHQVRDDQSAEPRLAPGNRLELDRSSAQTMDGVPSRKPTPARAWPPVSCICLTYGRPALLEEAIESFLRQDYPGPKELIVLNDFAGQTLELDHPEVRVINIAERFRTVGEKCNAAVALASHDLLFVWDDDDLFLPHRITFSVEHFDPAQGFFKPHQAWFLNSGDLSGPVHNFFHVGSCYTRELFQRVQGYAAMGNGYDQEIEARFEEVWPGSTKTYAIQPADVYYIYRWGGSGSYHMSGLGREQPGENQEQHDVADYVLQQVQAGAVPQGLITLTPRWRLDYSALVRAQLDQAADRSESAAPA